MMKGDNRRGAMRRPRQHGGQHTTPFMWPVLRSSPLVDVLYEGTAVACCACLIYSKLAALHRQKKEFHNICVFAFDPRELFLIVYAGMFVCRPQRQRLNVRSLSNFDPHTLLAVKTLLADQRFASVEFVCVHFLSWDVKRTSALCSAFRMSEKVRGPKVKRH